MATCWADPPEARVRAAATRARSAKLRAELDWNHAIARIQMQRAKALLALAELTLGLGLVWEDLSGELDGVLYSIDGGLLERPAQA